MKQDITDDYIGKYAILKIGYASGLVGIIEKNESKTPFVSPYKHVTKSGIATGVRELRHLEFVELSDVQK